MATPEALAMQWIAERRKEVALLEPLFLALGDTLDLAKRAASLTQQIKDAEGVLENVQSASEVARTQAQREVQAAATKTQDAQNLMDRAQTMMKDAERKAAATLDDAIKRKDGIEQQIGTATTKLASLNEEMDKVLGKFRKT